MDAEARNRGTTVYLTEKRIDMIPGYLGTDLCSLRSNVDRLAFSGSPRECWSMGRGRLVELCL